MAGYLPHFLFFYLKAFLTSLNDLLQYQSAPVSCKLYRCLNFVFQLQTHYYDTPSDTQKLEKLENMLHYYFGADFVKIFVSLWTRQKTQAETEKNSVARAGGKKRFTKVTA